MPSVVSAREMCRAEVVSGQERRGLDYTDALIRALGIRLPFFFSLFFSYVSLCKVLVNM